MPADERLHLQPKRLADLPTRSELQKEIEAFEAESTVKKSKVTNLQDYAARVGNWRDLLARYEGWGVNFVDTLNHNRESAGLKPVDYASPELDRMIYFDRWQQYYERFEGQVGVLYIRVQAYSYPVKAKTGKQGHLVHDTINDERKRVALTLAQHLMGGDDNARIGAKQLGVKALRRESTGGTIPAACRMSWFKTTLRTHDWEKEAFAVAVMAYDPYYAKRQQQIYQAVDNMSDEEMRALWQNIGATEWKVPVIHAAPEATMFDPVLGKEVPISEYRQD